YVDNPGLHTAGNALLLLVHPGPASSLTMYDGTESPQEAATRSVSLTSVGRQLQLHIRIANSPPTVRLGTAALPQVAVPDVATVAAGWGYDTAAKLLHVTFRHPGGTAQVSY